jgi:hypothetical protein
MYLTSGQLRFDFNLFLSILSRYIYWLENNVVYCVVQEILNFYSILNERKLAFLCLSKGFKC